MGAIEMIRKQTLHAASKEFFGASLAVYLLIILAETLKSGYVSYFFNINFLLIVVLVTGVTMVLTDTDRLLLRSAQKLFTYPTDEITRLVNYSKNEVPRTTAVRHQGVLRANSRVMDFSMRSIARMPQIRRSPLSPGQPRKASTKGAMDIVKK